LGYLGAGGYKTRPYAKLGICFKNATVHSSRLINMIRFIHLERRFEKELEDLLKRGERGVNAGQKAEELIKVLTQNGPPDLKRSGN
jgi:hypothetical protein